MSDISPRRRLIGRALIGASALALPMTASFSYAAAQAQDNAIPPPPPLPAPPAAVAPPAPPAPPAPEARDERRVQRFVFRQPESRRDRRVERRFVIRTPDGTRTVEGPQNFEMHFDGLSDDPATRRQWEEWGRQMDEWGKKYGRQMQQWGERFGRQWGEQARTQRFAFRTVPQLPQVPQPPQAPSAPLAPRAAPQPWAVPHAAITPEMLQRCRGGDNGSSETTLPDGRHQVVICNRGAPGQALNSLRATRDRIARNSALSEDVRRDVLQDLDREIERLQRDGDDQH